MFANNMLCAYHIACFLLFVFYLNMSMNFSYKLTAESYQLACGEYRSRTDGLLRARQAL